MAPWCSGLTCHPVTVEIGGSNPPGVASSISGVTFMVQLEERSSSSGIGFTDTTLLPSTRICSNKPPASLFRCSWLVSCQAFDTLDRKLASFSDTSLSLFLG